MKSAVLFLLTNLIFLGSAAQAQTADCSSPANEFFTLRTPVFDEPVSWKKNLGVEGADRVGAVVSLADGGLIVAGDSSAYIKDKGLQPMQVYLARFDAKGKQVWEKRMESLGLTRVVTALALKDRIVVLSEINGKDKSRSAKLDFYDGLGKLKNSKTISDGKLDFVPRDMLTDKTGLVLAIWAINRSNANDNSTYLVRTDASGEIKGKREYLPGVQNRLESIARLADGGLIGTGQITTAGGVKAGWVLRTGADGDLVFQQTYARGMDALLRAGAALGNGQLLVAGDSKPSDGSPRAAWLMALSPDGYPVWQKFMKGKYDYNAVDLTASKDGRYFLLMNGRPNGGKNGGRQHARLETFSASGKMLADESYIDGSNALGRQIIIRDTDRILAGISDTGLKNYSDVKNNIYTGYDIWISSLPALKAYRDPCAVAAGSSDTDNPF